MTRIVVLSRRDITHPLSGGAGRYIHEIFSRLAKRYSIEVLAQGGEYSKSVEVIDGVTYHHFPGKFQRLTLPAQYVTKFARGTDLLVDNADVAIPWMSPIFSRTPRIAIVYQVAGTIFHHELRWPLSELAFRLEPKMYQMYRNSSVVTCSPSTKNDLTRIGLSSEKISVILPGIDESFRRYEGGSKKFDDPTVVCISRFRRYKGLQFAVEAMKYVLQAVPRAKLVIVGNGDPSYIKSEVSRTPYADSITILERPPNKWNPEKIQLLSKAHLLLIPSVREGYGIVVIEANACGTPAVGWAVPGVQDSIINGKTGSLVPFGNVELLGQTIGRFLGDHAKISDMSKVALEWSRQHSWDKAASEFERRIEDSLVNPVHSARA